ncbi:MAG: MEMAR_RS02690 family S-layer glycoprotein [Methanoregula sp.]
MIVALFIMVAAMPAAGAFYSVNTSIHQGATVYIGEQGLNLTPAIREYPNTTADRPIYIGWWASAAQIGTTAPTTRVIISNPYNFFVSDAIFGGYYGNWYALNAAGLVNQSRAFMMVKDPQLSVEVWDYSLYPASGGISVTGRTVVQGDILGFKVRTNMDTAISQPTQRTKKINSEVTGWADIKVKTEQGNTFNKLIASDGAAIGLTGQSINTPSWYWAGNGVKGLSGNWSTGATDINGQFIYPNGTYTVTVESKMNGMLDNYLNGGAAYAGKTVSQAQTVTIVSNTLKITANKDSVVRSKPFSVTITGRQNTIYHLWVKGTSSMSGGYNDQPPMISKYQVGVSQDSNATDTSIKNLAPYQTDGDAAFVASPNAGGYLFENSGSTTINGTIWYDVAHGSDARNRFTLGNGTALYASISFADSVTRWIEFITTNWTKPQKYTIRVERNFGNDTNPVYKSDEVDVRVERGAATIVAAGNQSYYLGEEIRFSGTNTETQTTYLFITGSNLPQYGAQINSPNPQNAPVVNNDPTTFQQASVLGDNTWIWKWRTSNVTLDNGTYTVWAASAPSDMQSANLEKCVYSNVSIRIDPISRLPIAEFTSTNTTGTAPITIAFFDTSSNCPTSWFWDFGDGTFSTEQNPVHTYTSPGIYTVSLTVTNTFGEDSVTQSNFITVTSPISPTTDYYPVNTSIHQGATVFIGEQGMNLTPALAYFSKDAPDSIGWWASAAQIGTTAPIKTVVLTNPEDFLVSYAAFGSYYGNWFALNGTTGAVNQSAVFMIVNDPQLSIDILDYSLYQSYGGTSVSGRSVVQGDILGFKVGTNMDTAINQPTQRTKKIDTEVTGWADIKVKTEQGNTFTNLTGSDGIPHGITGQKINNLSWIWDNNTAGGLNGNWSTSAMDSTGQFAYPVGTYTVSVESKMNGMLNNYQNSGATYTGKTVSQAQTVTLVPNRIKITANKDSVVRSKFFSVTITGRQNTIYHLWVKGTSSMSGGYDDQPPMIAKYQAGVSQDAFAGTGTTQGTLGCEPYLTAYVSGKVGNAGGYIFQNSSSTDRNNPYVGSIWADVAHGGNPGTTSTTDIERMVKLGNGTYLYANVSLSDSGTRTVEFTTSNWTKIQKYTIRVEQNMSGSYKSDEVDMSVERGAATIVAAGNQSYYLGEEIGFSGTNTRSQTTYLFITGPNLPQYGAQINSPNPQNAPVVNNDPTTFQQASVLGDNTWSWKWSTSNVTLDNGTYTVWAASAPSDMQSANLEKCVYGNVSIRINPISRLPIAEFTSTNTTGTAPITIAFFDTSSNCPTSWFWDFGDGTFSTEQNPVHTFTSPGIYTVSLTVTNTFGEDSVTQSNFITVTSPISPTTGYYPVNTSIHHGATVYIGEQGLNLTPALAYFSKDAPASIGWWASAAQIGTTAPTKTVVLTNPEDFHVSYADFGWYFGNWFALNGTTGAVNQSTAFMMVKDPQISIDIWDYSQGNQGGISVSGKSVVQGDTLGFKVGTNMDTAINQPTQRTKKIDTEVTGWADIKVKTEQGNTFTALLASDGTAVALTGQSINTPTWYWAGNAAGLAGNWSTSATDITGQFAYPVGTYTVSVESKMNGMRDNYLNAGAAYTGKTVSQAQTVTLVSNMVKITANKDSVVRSKPFSVTITGKPNTVYHLWIKTSTMSGSYDDQPPMIAKYQAGVSQDSNATDTSIKNLAPYQTDGDAAFFASPNAGGYLFENSGSTTITGTVWYDVAHGSDARNRFTLGNGTALYANVSLSDYGTRTVEFVTTNWTKAQKYTIRVERNFGTDANPVYKSDEVDVRVERGTTTIVAAGDQDYYPGEEIRFSGTNTGTYTTYLFITGPNLSQYGAQINSPNPQNAPVVNNDPTTFQQASVLGDNTWSWKWKTSNVNLDAGTYTVWAANHPSDSRSENLATCAFSNVSIIIKSPFHSVRVFPPVIAQGESVTVSGYAEDKPSAGVAVWIMGTQYANRTVAAVTDAGSFSTGMNNDTTRQCTIGKYYVVVQHPMKNAQFDIYLNTSDGCVYNRQIGIPDTKLFKFTGTGSIQGADAAEALIQVLQELNVDDAYANLTFTIRNGSNPPSISLYQGWNFISIPKKLSSGNNTAAIFSSIDTDGHSIYLYNASEQRWHAMTLNDKVQPLDGIWLYANNTADVNFSFDTNPMQTPPTKSLSAGWNAIGFSDTTPIATRTALNSVKTRWSTLIGFNAPQQHYDAAIVNGATDAVHGDQLNMYPGKGYWLYMTKAGELAAIGA